MFPLLCPLAFLLLFPQSHRPPSRRAAVAALFSFFSFPSSFFFFFLFSLASPCSESFPQLLLGEPVWLLLDGSGVVSSIRPFLDGVCSLFWGVSFVGVSLGVATFPGVLNTAGAHRWHLLWCAMGVSPLVTDCHDIAGIAPSEQPSNLLMWASLPLGMWASSARGSGGGGRSQVLRWMSLLFCPGTLGAINDLLSDFSPSPTAAPYSCGPTRWLGPCPPVLALRAGLSLPDPSWMAILCWVRYWSKAICPWCCGGVRLKQQEEYLQGKVRHIHPQEKSARHDVWLLCPPTTGNKGVRCWTSFEYCRRLSKLSSHEYGGVVHRLGFEILPDPPPLPASGPQWTSSGTPSYHHLKLRCLPDELGNLVFEYESDLPQNTTLSDDDSSSSYEGGVTNEVQGWLSGHIGQQTSAQSHRSWWMPSWTFLRRVNSVFKNLVSKRHAMATCSLARAWSSAQQLQHCRTKCAFHYENWWPGPSSDRRGSPPSIGLQDPWVHQSWYSRPPLPWKPELSDFVPISVAVCWISSSTSSSLSSSSSLSGISLVELPASSSSTWAAG